MPANNPLRDLPPWDPSDLDREIKASRAKRQAAKPQKKDERREHIRVNGRGWATDDDLQRRAEDHHYLRNGD